MEIYKIRTAEKEGRLIILPCMVDDPLYYINSRGEIEELKVRVFWMGRFTCNHQSQPLMIRTTKYDFPADDLGKKIYLTYEEAEKALAEGKHANPSH